MPIDRERQRLVREGVEQVRRMLAEPVHENAVDDGARCANLAEVLAILTAQARALGSDEVLVAEILLTATGSHRQTLLEARQILAPLGSPI